MLIAHGIDLSPADTDILRTRTRGLARRSAHGRARPPARPPYGRVPRQLRRRRTASSATRPARRKPSTGSRHAMAHFLLRTAVTDHVYGDNARHLASSASGGGADTLERLSDGAGFVIPVEGRRGWFRHHRRFGELLRGRLRHHDPSEAAACHRRASAWYTEHGQPLDALRRAVAPEIFLFAAHALAEAWLGLFISGERAFLREMLAELPADLVARHGDLSVAGGPGILRRPSAEASARAPGPLARRRAVGPRATVRGTLRRRSGDSGRRRRGSAGRPRAAVTGRERAVVVRVRTRATASPAGGDRRPRQRLRVPPARRARPISRSARTLHHGPATANEEPASQATARSRRNRTGRGRRRSRRWLPRRRTSQPTKRVPAQQRCTGPRPPTLTPRPTSSFALNRLRALLDGTPKQDTSETTRRAQRRAWSGGSTRR